MQRIARLILPSAALLAVACSGGDRSLPTAPPSTPSVPQSQPSTSGVTPGVSPFVAQNCSAASVTTLISQLLPQPLATSVSTLVNQLRLQASNGQRDRAQATALRIIDVLIKARNNGLFANDPARLQRLGTLIQTILCVADLPQSPIDLSTGAAAVISPTSPPTTLSTPNRFAGVQVPTGAVTQTVLVTITPAQNPGTGPLLTDLDQYPLFYEFSTSPVQTFPQRNVTVAVCAQDPTPDLSNLRLAHNIGTAIGDVEILAPAPFAGIIDCTNVPNRASARQAPSNLLFASWERMERWARPIVASALLPTPAYASSLAFGGRGLGGLPGSFSPFGAVDITSVVIESSGPSSFGGAAGSSVTPTVITRKTPNALSNPGGPARGIDVTFAVSEGGGSTSPATARTGTDGKASTTWTLAAGNNTLTASAVNGRASFGGTTVVPGSPVTFRSSASTPATFSYGAPNWRTLVVPPSGFDIGWVASGFYDGDWTVGQAAFGMASPPDTYCSFYSPNQATTLTFLPGTSIALRRRFLAPNGAATGVLAISVDNDVKVYVNGTLLTSATDANGGAVSADESGYFIHEGCPTSDEFLFPLSGLSAADNTLTIIARDRGGSTYFDAEVRASPPPIQ